MEFASGESEDVIVNSDKSLNGLCISTEYNWQSKSKQHMMEQTMLTVRQNRMSSNSYGDNHLKTKFNTLNS